MSEFEFVPIKTIEYGQDRGYVGRSFQEIEARTEGNVP